MEWIMGLLLKWADKAHREEDKLITSALYRSRTSELVGILERVIIIWLVMMNSISALTFLMILKSVARHPDLSKNHKDIEVFIIGTLTSFTVGIAFGVIFKYLCNKI